MNKYCEKDEKLAQFNEYYVCVTIALFLMVGGEKIAKEKLNRTEKLEINFILFFNKC